MPDHDLVLLETVKTHRTRLVSAFLSGELAERRVINDNVRRLIGGVVAAAVTCAGCVGFSFIAGQLAKQSAQQREQQAIGQATGPVFASDTFDRTAATGWGRAERGGTWAMGGAANAYSVHGGAGRINLTDDRYRGGYLPGLLQDHTDLTVRVQPTRPLGHRSVILDVIGRRVSSTQDYQAVVELGADGRTSVSLVRVDQPGPGGTPVARLSPIVTQPGSAGSDAGGSATPVSIRMQVIGSGTDTTTLRAKVWTGNSEPEGWTVTGSDDSADLQRPGTIGLSARSANASTVGQPVGLDVTDLIARVAP